MYDVWYFYGYVCSKIFSTYPAYGWKVSPNYFATKTLEVYICIGCCIFLDRDSGGRKKSICVQLMIPSTYVRLSQACYNGDFVWTFPPGFNSSLLLKVCYHHLGNRVTLIIYLYYLRTMPLGVLVFRLQRIWVPGLVVCLFKFKPITLSLLIQICFIESHTSWPHQHLFMWAVKIQSFYAYLCKFYYSRFYLAQFYLILYSITYVNICSGISRFENLFYVYYLRHYLKRIYRFWHNRIMDMHRVWNNHIMELFSLPSFLFYYW